MYVTMNRVVLRPSAARRRRGVAAVEFAVIASLLFTLLLGIVEIGRAMMVLELLNNAARNGVRTATINGSTRGDVATAVTNALGGSGITLAAGQPKLSVNGTEVTSDAGWAPASGDTISVSVSVPYADVSWLPTSFFLTGRSLSSTAVMRRE